MKNKYKWLMLACLPMLSFGQEIKEEIINDQDSIEFLASDKIHLSDIIIKGDFFTDPTFTIEVNNQDKKAVQPKNVADLFQDVDGMSFIKRGNYAIDPSFRASQYEELNIQYDGGVKAMHACPNRMDPVTTHVLPEDIDKIEIIKGPYSVRYGANFGGVINMVTNKPGLGDLGISGDLKAGYESNGNTYLTSAGLKYVANKFHVKGNLGYRDFGNYKDGNGVEVPSAFRSTDYSLGAGFSPSIKHHFMANWRQSFGRDVLHAGLPMDTDSDDSSIFSFDYYADHLEGKIKQVAFKVYYSFVDHVMSNSLRPSFNKMSAVSEVEATTYGGKLEAQYVPNENLKLYLGADMFNVERAGTKYMIKKLDMQGNPIANPSTMETDVWQDAYVNDLGLFVEANYQLKKPLVLKAGLRLDFIESKPELVAENFKQIYGELDTYHDTNFSGHIGLKFSPNKKMIYELAIGQGVRSANMTERYINYFTVGQDRYNYVGNPNLKPEINRQVELGFKNKARLNENSQVKFNYGASVYYSMIENYISAIIDPSLATMTAPDVKTYINVEEAYKTGFELFVDTQFNPRWSFGTSLAYVYAKNKDFDESLPLLPPFTAKFNLMYERDDFGANLKFRALSTQKNLATSFGETETPGYGIWDFEMTYMSIKGLSIGGAVQNMFDKAYHNHQNFSYVNQADFGNVPINEPGRNFSVFTRYSF
ncbi:TonB-dependent receptor [Weeksellaceae bacterium KMM 9724]|nr:TonB-dependent receptor [Profundicola chukchiensis]